VKVVELRAAGGHAEVAGAPLSAEEPHGRLWGLPDELVAALQAWARRTADGPGAPEDPAREAVSREGRVLAARLSAVLGAPVDYLDPVSGHRVALRAVTRTPRPPPVPLPPRPAGQVAAPRGEPTPWATGLALSVLVAGLVMLTNLALATPMVAGLGGLGLVIDVLVALGLVPALWLNRHVPTWRWAVYGTLAGMVLALPVLAVGATG
jgi:hypothetical protein